MDIKNLTNTDWFKILQDNWFPCITENWKILGILVAVLFLFFVFSAWKWIVFCFVIIMIAMAIKVTSLSTALDKMGTTIMKSMIESDKKK